MLQSIKITNNILNDNIVELCSLIKNTLINLPFTPAIEALNLNIKTDLNNNKNDLSILIKETFDLNQENLKITLSNIIAELGSVKTHNINVSQQLLNLSNNFTQETYNELQKNLLLINQEVIKQFTKNC
jgi:hypothetical protein